MDHDKLLMAVRLGLQFIAGVLVARGFGDAPMWEAVIGAAVVVIGFILSDRSREKLRAKALAGDKVIGALKEAARP